MGFAEAIKSWFNKYVTFSGRAPRSEYWWFTLFAILAQIVLTFVDMAVFGANPYGIDPLATIFSLAVLLPGLAVTVRRLHDTGRSAWWLLIVLIPVIGYIVLIVFACLKSEPGANRFGPNPLTGDEDLAEVFA